MTHHRRHGNNDTGTYDAEMTTALSPAQRYAAFKQTQAKRQSVSSRFARSMPFELDDFQVKANDALEAGDNVLVAAPTGAGKTVVADFAIYLAQERNVKAFYTTPIKALSNQKYHDLVETYGPDRVGLLTGDTSINSEADIVVIVSKKDIGKVIGKQGKIAKAIRTLVKAASGHSDTRYNVVIEEKE